MTEAFLGLVVFGISSSSHILTFDLAVMEGAGTLPLGAQPSAARETQRPPQIWLVGALRARLARLEPVPGEVAHGTLAWTREREPLKDPAYRAEVGAASSRTCAGGDVPGADGAVAVAAGAEVAGQLPLPLLKSARRTQHAALLLAVVIRPR